MSGTSIIAQIFVPLTGDRAQGDDSKHDSHYNDNLNLVPKQIMISMSESPCLII